MVQVIVDNFDANISSQNGLQSTHGLAMLLTQPGENKESARHAETIPRIKKEDMVKQVEDDVKVHRFVGPHKPDTHWWTALPHELHWLCRGTDGRKWSGRHSVVCFWWCRSHDDRQEISTEFPCIANTCRSSNREDRAGNQ